MKCYSALVILLLICISTFHSMVAVSPIISYLNKDQDCSCHHSCLRRGDCCDDFENECQEEIRKESHLNLGNLRKAQNDSQLHELLNEFFMRDHFKSQYDYIKNGNVTLNIIAD